MVDASFRHLDNAIHGGVTMYMSAVFESRVTAAESDESFFGLLGSCILHTYVVYYTHLQRCSGVKAMPFQLFQLSFDIIRRFCASCVTSKLLHLRLLLLWLCHARTCVRLALAFVSCSCFPILNLFSLGANPTRFFRYFGIFVPEVLRSYHRVRTFPHLIPFFFRPVFQ